MRIQHLSKFAVSLMAFSLTLGALADGPFIGGSIGNARLDESFDGLNVKDNSTAYRIVAGWRFSEYFALEGGYQNFGDFEQTFSQSGNQVRASLSADGFTFGAEGSFPIGERFAILGRAGVFFWNGTAEVNNVSQASPEDVNAYFGAGMGFQLTQKVRVSGDWTRFDLKDADSNVFSLGLRYAFR